MIVERRLLPHLDWPLLGALVALALIGVATIYSVTWNHVAGEPGREFWTQVYALPVAFAALAACWRSCTWRCSAPCARGPAAGC
jgi:cell division protein FtsW (lipid II flippase)